MTPIALLASVAVAGMLFFGGQAVTHAFTRNRRRISARLTQQTAGAGAALRFDTAATTVEGILRRDGRLGKRLDVLPFMSAWRSDLQRAGLSWKAKDYVGVIAVAAAIMGIGSFAVTGSALLALAATALGAVAPVLFVKRRVTSRSTMLSSQVADTIDLLAASLRAGFSVMQSLELAAQEQPEPIALELQWAMREMNLGMSVDEALARLVDRTQDEDLELVVSAILIQRRVGGNLGEVLGNIAQMIRDRVRVRGEIRTLTAQARMSSWIVGLLPVALGAGLTVMRPEYMSVLWEDSTGQMLTMMAVAMELLGFYVIRRIAAIDY